MNIATFVEVNLPLQILPLIMVDTLTVVRELGILTMLLFVASGWQNQTLASMYMSYDHFRSV